MTEITHIHVPLRDDQSLEDAVGEVIAHSPLPQAVADGHVPVTESRWQILGPAENGQMLVRLTADYRYITVLREAGLTVEVE